MWRDISAIYVARWRGLGFMAATAARMPERSRLRADHPHPLGRGSFQAGRPGGVDDPCCRTYCRRRYRRPEAAVIGIFGCALLCRCCDGRAIGVLGVGATGPGRLPQRRSRWSRPSPTRRSSPSRTRGCSRSWRRERASSARRWSSRRRPPRCCGSSAAPPIDLQPVLRDAHRERRCALCEAGYGRYLHARGRRHACDSRPSSACRRVWSPTRQAIRSARPETVVGRPSGAGGTSTFLT